MLWRSIVFGFAGLCSAHLSAEPKDACLVQELGCRDKCQSQWDANPNASEMEPSKCWSKCAMKGACRNSRAPTIPTSRTSIFDATKTDDQKSVESFLKSGIAVDSRGEGDETPLHWAALYGRTSIAELLINNNGDVRAKDNSGSTPLHGAAEEGHLELVETLIRSNADINAANNDGITPLHLAAARGQLTVVMSLLKHGANIDAADKSGSTALHLACAYGEKNVVTLLLAEKANARAKDNDGNTPSTVAEANGYDAIAQLIISQLKNE